MLKCQYNMWPMTSTNLSVIVVCRNMKSSHFIPVKKTSHEKGEFDKRPLRGHTVRLCYTIGSDLLDCGELLCLRGPSAALWSATNIENSFVPLQPQNISHTDRPSPPGVQQPLANFHWGLYFMKGVKNNCTFLPTSPTTVCMCVCVCVWVHLTPAMSCAGKSKTEIDVQQQNQPSAER